MDNSLLTELFGAVVEACEALGRAGDADCAAAEAALPRIRPPSIGSAGQMLEWRREYSERKQPSVLPITPEGLPYPWLLLVSSSRLSDTPIYFRNMYTASISE